jgi:AcrR family transcriptional regulator
MPRQRFFNLPHQERARLLRIATKHFAKRGFDGASLNEMLAESGISKGAYYYYFDDKDDLFVTALESGLDATLARFAMPQLDTVTREEFWPTVERFINEWAASFDSSSDLFKVAIQLTDAQRKSPRFAPMLKKAQTIYRMLIEPGRRLGCVRTDLSTDVLVRLLEANDAVLDSIFFSAHPNVSRASVTKHVKIVFDTFKRLLVANAFSDARAPTRIRSRRG